jgi:hypothetical protein
MQTSRKRQRIQRAPAILRTGVPIQKCPELVPDSPLGAYDGRAKWAAVLVIGGSVGADSVTTPSWDDEAQAESSHAITKGSTAYHAACLFTKPNLLIEETVATSGIRGRC